MSATSAPIKLAIAESGLVPILTLPISSLTPSPENDSLYRPVDLEAPDIISLAESILVHGLREPIVITTDHFILSGHRRYAAARRAGLREVPVRVEPVSREDEPDKFLVLLREYNRQREKTLDEKLREEVVSANPDEVYQSLIEYRHRKAEVEVDTITIGKARTRAAISAAKRPFLDAVLLVIEDRRDYWPLSDRQIHYALLNNPPLRHASKKDSIYENDVSSYKSLVDLLTRARIDGSIPFEIIADPTRPVSIWKAFPNPQDFIRDELGSFLKGYWRDLQQSQPNHIEIIGEKNTVASMLATVASEYCIPLTVGRGYCSLPPRHAIAKRYAKSGREKLILLMVSDFDPDGEVIASSFARSMRDDFDIENVEAIKVALTGEQVKELGLSPVMKAKPSSVHHKSFTAKHGDNVFELEAIAPATLQQMLRDAIDGVLDITAFNDEIAAEWNDAQFLDGVRQRVSAALRHTDLSSETIGGAK